MHVWRNAIGYQLVWFCAVIGAGRGLWWPGVLAAVVFVCLQVGASRQRGIDLRLIGVALLLGATIDGGLAASGWLHYSAVWPSPHFAPVWILAVWAAFATTLTRSLALLRQRPRWALLLGAIGGPVSYLGAARGWGAVTFVDLLPGMVALACAWAVAMPLLAHLARRWSRNRDPRMATR